jgi:hypothetical protein
MRARIGKAIKRMIIENVASRQNSLPLSTKAHGGTNAKAEQNTLCTGMALTNGE